MEVHLQLVHTDLRPALILPKFLHVLLLLGGF